MQFILISKQKPDVPEDSMPPLVKKENVEAWTMKAEARASIAAPSYPFVSDRKISSVPHRKVWFVMQCTGDPPLRLLLGSKPLPLIRQVYAERLKSWAEWADISHEAQGGGGT